MLVRPSTAPDAAPEFTRLHSDERGVTAVEYAIIGSLIAGVVLSVVGILGTKVSGAMDLLSGQW